MKEAWNTIVNFFTNNKWLWKILLFFVVLFAGLILVKLIMRLLRKLFNKTRIEKIAQNFILAIIKFFLYLLLIFGLLTVVDVKLDGIITALSAILLAVGMALENNIANLANGIIIVSTHMFKKGDYIVVDGKEGNITEINFLFTTIMTLDNRKVTIPNSTVVNSSVINAGANKKRRVDFTFSVAYETDVEKVKEIVTNVMKSDGRVDLDPAPFCRLKTLGASSIDFFANCWCDGSDYWDVYYYVMENVYNEFKRNNISIPYNQLEVRNRTDKVVMPYNKAPLQKRVEKVREEEPHHFDLEKDDLIKVTKAKTKEAKKDKKAKEKKAKEQKAKEKTAKKSK